METSLRYGGDSKALRIHAKEKVPIDSNTFFQVHGELDTRVGQASSLSAQIRHFYPSLSATLGVGLRYDKHEKIRYTEGLVEIREDYIEDSHKGETKSTSFIDVLAPAELEGIFMSHPSIEDAAVVPQKDDVAGEVPVAFVVRSSNDPI